jgi:hypothetical protein
MRLIDADAMIEKCGDWYVEEGTESGFIGTLKNLLVTQPTITPEPHWIPVTVRLPEVGESVLICDAYGDICIGHRTMGGYYFPDFCDDKIKDVRAWCELPEPYKGVTE